MLPSSTCPCDEAQAETVLGLVDALEDLDDVQNVHTNGDFPDSVF